MPRHDARNGAPSTSGVTPGRARLSHARASVRRGRREAIVWMGPGRVARFIARYRRSWALRNLAVLSQMFLSAFENEDWDFRRNGEEHLLAAAGRVLPEGSLIFDVGAFDGLWAHAALRHASNAHVHCFEIVDTFGAELTALFARNSRVTVNPFGLWSHRARRVAHFNPELPSMTSVVSAVHRYTGQDGSALEATMETGDEYCRRLGIDHVDYVKIDVEGAELEVMRGFTELLGGHAASSSCSSSTAP